MSKIQPPTPPSASVDNTLLDLPNSSHPTQPHSLIAKYQFSCTKASQLLRVFAWLAKTSKSQVVLEI